MALTKKISQIAVPPMSDWWDDDTRGVSEPELVVDVQGFEGPMDLLLHLSRTQKVDLTRISIVALVDQYLYFIKQVQQVRLELAADYLVMAAWLAYLKSRLLVPKKQGEEGESGEELAQMLQFRLRRLEAMREAGAKLINRNRLGRDIFKRGFPEMVVVERKNRFNTSLYELLTAYTGIRQRQAVSHVEVGNRKVWPLKYARQVLSRMFGGMKFNDWHLLDNYLLAFISDEKERKTAIASAFAASLEMVREGEVELRQSSAFAPLYLRARTSDTLPNASPDVVADTGLGDGEQVING